MKMTPEQIKLVQDSFRLVLPIQLQAGQIFYDRLFTLDPTLRPLFKEDLSNQIRALMAMLTTVVAKLNRLDELVPAVESLGRRHVQYGVQPEHYVTVGAALLDTLEQGLGPSFTDATREAWAAAFTTLATVMQEAARAELPA
jgi:hemoglobin-like flavoprotein